MKAEHTAGPWSHELTQLCDGYDAKGKQINPRTVKDYYTVTAGEKFWREDDNSKGFNLAGYMSEANARLIAAAPELLEALEAVVRLKNLIEYPRAVEEKHIGEAMALSGMILKAEDAIKKARGL